ncbi:hypothetical protein ONZ45_g19399 [Pleurotus djamor]|nr:hypothetical protein ONZ45_g19399 [Pleurotus djamor]
MLSSQPYPRHMFIGSYKPEEDPDWEAYTLGKAPATPEPGADLTVAEQNAIAANFELAKGAGSRYLVQKWSDGTFCEQTGKPREVEVQFHCSMTMTDTILFVKETKTCSYVLVINTPRLCGEPGFRSPRDSRSEAVIRCRSIVENDRDVPVLENRYTESEFPFKIPRKSKSIPAPPETQKPSDKPEKNPPRMSGERVDEMVRKALQSFAENKAAGVDGNTPEPQVVVKHTDGDHYVVEFLDEISLDDLQEAESHIDRLTDILRAAGFDIRDTIIDHKDDLDGDEQSDSTSHGQASKKAHPDLHRDEL